MAVKIEGGSPSSSEEFTVILESGFDFVWVSQPNGDLIQIGNDTVTVFSGDVVTYTSATDVRVGDNIRDVG